MTRLRRLPAILALLLGGLSSGIIRAQEPNQPEPDDGGPRLSWSAFGTLGWAVSDQSWGYQHSISQRGTLRRDSLLGGQLDVQFDPSWSATLQLKLSPSLQEEHAWQLQPSWAFVAWRPDNDWLIRAGKLRLPFFLRSEQQDVGQTYADARLPSELYGLVPSDDFTGLHVSRSWNLDGSDLSLDAYEGRTDLYAQNWSRDGLPGAIEAGMLYAHMKMRARGLVATWSDTGTRVRAGLHQLRMDSDVPFTIAPVLVEIPGTDMSFWKIDNRIPLGALVEQSTRMDSTMAMIGIETPLGPRWRLSGELMRIRQSDVVYSMDLWSGYLSVARDCGRLTPYLTIGRTLSTMPSRQWTAVLDRAAPLPDAIPGAAAINASVKFAADLTMNYDQHSIALGTSYALGPRSRLKAEWQRVQARQSDMYDLPAGSMLVQPRGVSILSLGWSFVY